MVTQVGIPTQLGDEGLDSGSAAQTEGCSGALSDLGSQLGAAQVEAVHRQSATSGLELADASLGSVRCSDDGDELTPCEMPQDDISSADDTASAGRD